MSTLSIELENGRGLRLSPDFDHEISLNIRVPKSDKRSRILGIHLTRDEAQQVGERLLEYAETGE